MLIGTEAYLAPEIHEGKEYSGSAVDIFNIGIILFMMVTKTRPFEKPLKTDAYYKPICEMRSEMFWKIHEKANPEIFEGISSDLKDLIIGLLQYNPLHRLSLSEIINHSWLKGDLPTQDEIYNEFM